MIDQHFSKKHFRNSIFNRQNQSKLQLHTKHEINYKHTQYESYT